MYTTYLLFTDFNLLFFTTSSELNISDSSLTEGKHDDDGKLQCEWLHTIRINNGIKSSIARLLYSPLELRKWSFL